MQIPDNALTNHEVTICLHDTYTNSVHCLILKFEDVTGIYDNVKLRG